MLCSAVAAFSVPMAGSRRPRLLTTELWSTAPEKMENMRLRDIQAELKNMGVTYSDCFDKESLVTRLKEAREGKFEIMDRSSSEMDEKKESADKTSRPSSTSPAQSPPELDSETILGDLRSKTLKDLKIECSRRNLRYATFLEKEDFVQAVWKDLQSVAAFSVSGAIRPGHACEITGEQLSQELTSDSTPILLDVYATWCGPCKMMAPELEKAAEELGTKCRVAKLDSDKFPEWAGRYQVQGLPTVLLLKDGGVQDKREGALMKRQLLDLAEAHLSK